MKSDSRLINDPTDIALFIKKTEPFWALRDDFRKKKHSAFSSKCDLVFSAASSLLNLDILAVHKDFVLIFRTTGMKVC